MSLLQRIVRAFNDLRRPQPAGLEALFTIDGLPEPPLARTSAPTAVAVRCDAIGCLSCSPVHHPADVTRVYWWLREGPYAHVWYDAPSEEVEALAKSLLTLQRDFQRGRWGRR